MNQLGCLSRFQPVFRITNQLSSSTICRKISTYPTDTEEEMTITDDGNVIVCWHPEKSFPYEYTKPLPLKEEVTNPLFKMETKEEIYKSFKNKKQEFMIQELMKLTSTTKHIWYRWPRMKYARVVPNNRRYL